MKQVERDEVRAWFEREGLMRYAASADADGGYVERACEPVVALGPLGARYVLAPDPARQRYPQPLAAMELDAFNDFMYRWLEAATRDGQTRCAQCGKPLRDQDDLPDADTWDAIFVEKELVGWMLVHFDCKRLLPKKLKGVNPFELTVAEPPTYDLSGVQLRERNTVGDARQDQAPREGVATDAGGA